jgi:hypothetical protein
MFCSSTFTVKAMWAKAAYSYCGLQPHIKSVDTKLVDRFAEHVALNIAIGMACIDGLSAWRVNSWPAVTSRDGQCCALVCIV